MAWATWQACGDLATPDFVTSPSRADALVLVVKLRDLTGRVFPERYAKCLKHVKSVSPTAKYHCFYFHP
jgi:hypothetical protein